MRSLLAALGLPAAASRDLSASRKVFNRRNRVIDLPPLVTGVANRPTRLEVSGSDPVPAELLLETGEVRPLSLAPARGRLRVPPIAEPGYHRLAVENRQIVLAIAPPRCRTVEDAVPDARLWGVSATLSGPSGIRDLAGALPVVRTAAAHGADAFALGLTASPGMTDPAASAAHGSRLFPDTAIAAPDLVFDGDLPPPSSAGHRPRDDALRQRYDSFLDGNDWDGPLGADFARFRSAAGTALSDHARFRAMHEDLAASSDSPGKITSWKSWPLDLRDPQSPAVTAFAAAHQEIVLYHQFAQWLTERSKAAIHQAALRSGMRIGLMAQLSLGVPENGSEVWSRQRSMILDTAIGAAPSAARPNGETRNLTAFSPRAMEAGGYTAFIEMLRAVMRHTGGVHIPHAGGLARQWLIPAGAAPADGAYLSYNATDFLRLIALESVRSQTIVTADLNDDAPADLREMLEQSAVHTNRIVLEPRVAASPPARPRPWTSDNIGMTTDPDGPSIRDLWTAAQPDGVPVLWDSLLATGSTETLPHVPDSPGAFVDAAIGHVAQTSAPLVLVPLHDIVEPDQSDAVMDQADAARRLDTLATLRPRY